MTPPHPGIGTPPRISLLFLKGGGKSYLPSPQTSPGGLCDVPQLSELSGIGETHLEEQREWRERRRRRRKNEEEGRKGRGGRGKGGRGGSFPHPSGILEPPSLRCSRVPSILGNTPPVFGIVPYFLGLPSLFLVVPTWCCLRRAPASCRKILAASGDIGTPRPGPSSNSAPSRGTSGTCGRDLGSHGIQGVRSLRGQELGWDWGQDGSWDGMGDRVGFSVG